MTSGALYVVATPLGNLEDFSPRACRILQEADLILAEDTRYSAALLRHFGIGTAVVAFHEHNEKKSISRILERLRSGEDIALISDAGTPLINDPGYELVAAAHTAGIRVVPIPGPAALICALSVSGLPTDRFVYEGFLPARAAARRQRLAELAAEPRTLVFYEVPHRIRDSLKDMIECFGPDRLATLAKELTKYHETVRRGTLAELLTWLNVEPERLKGEFVLLIRGNTTSPAADEAECRRVLEILLRSMSVREAAAAAARILNQSKNRLYAMALELSKKQDG